MADLLASNVTTLSRWVEGGTSMKRRSGARVKFTGTTAGGTSNKLLASAMGFKTIEDCSHLLLDSSTKKVYPAAPSADGTYITLAVPTQATDANRADAGDVATSTDYAYITVYGQSL